MPESFYEAWPLPPKEAAEKEQAAVNDEALADFFQQKPASL
jgi:hypothetical protein